MFYVFSVAIAVATLAFGLVLFPQYTNEITVGVLLPWANAMAGYSYVSRHLHGESKKFAFAALANTVLRLAMMLIVFTIVLVLLDVDEFVFIIALFFSYLYNSILETIYLQRLKPKT
jgi:uncharacterized membrane protein YjgN (DUF898 family)